MATLAPADITPAGVGLTFVAAAAGGDQVANDGKTLVHLKNTSGGAIVVTFVAQVACNQGTIHSTTVSVPATTGDRIVGPFPVERYNDGNGNLQITYASVTSLTVAAGSL